MTCGRSNFQIDTNSSRVLKIYCLELKGYQKRGRFMKHFKVLVLGSGSGGLAVTSKFLEYLSPVDMAIIDPSEFHYYQPFWTLVGGGVGKKEETRKPTKSVIPDGVEWLKQAITKVIPQNKTVVLANDEKVTYDFLVVATGLKF